MAVIAIDAVVDIARDMVVLEVVGVITAVATRALKDGVVIRIDVAGRAHVIRATMIRRKGCVLRVVEARSGPIRGVMAVLAGCGEELGLCRMAGVRRVVVIRLMASDASGRQRCVIAVRVAVAALPRRRFVRTGQGERGVVVIKG